MSALEARRMERLTVLARMRDRADRIAGALCDAIEGKLPAEDSPAVAHIANPVLAFTRVATAIRRIVALEERIDEDAEARAKRLADEEAARAKAEAAAVLAHNTDVNKRRVTALRWAAQKVVRGEIRARDNSMTRVRREMLLSDLTADLGDYDFMVDPETVMQQIMDELDDILGPKPPALKDAGENAHYRPPRRPRGWSPPSAEEAQELLLHTTNAIQAKLRRAADG
jgi:hypothetical protein